MKTFGLKSMIFVSVLFVVLLTAYFFTKGENGFGIALGIPIALTLAQYINLPVIKLNKSSIRVFTLNPFHKNIDVQFSDVSKIIVDLGNTMRITFHMNDDSYKSINTSRYAYDMKPFYHELTKSGVEIVSEGIDTVDWI